MKKGAIVTFGLDLGYSGNTGKIAKIHQYGLADWVGNKKRKAKMPKRDILGITEKDLNMIENEVIDVLKR